MPVDEADDVVARPADAADHPQHGCPHVARAGDEHPHLAGRGKQRPARLAKPAHQRAHPAQHDDRRPPIQQNHAARNGGQGRKEELDHGHRRQAAGGRPHQDHQIVERDRSAPPLTCPQAHEPRQLAPAPPNRRWRGSIAVRFPPVGPRSAANSPGSRCRQTPAGAPLPPARGDDAANRLADR